MKKKHNIDSQGDDGIEFGINKDSEETLDIDELGIHLRRDKNPSLDNTHKTSKENQSPQNKNSKNRFSLSCETPSVNAGFSSNKTGLTDSADNTHKTHLDKICKECIICKKKINNLYPKNDYVVKIETSHSLDKMWDDMETYYCCSRSCWKKFEKQLKTAELYEKKIDDAFGKLKDEIKARFRLLEVGDKSVIEEINKIREEMK